MGPLPDDFSPALDAVRWLLSFGALGFAFWLGKVLTRLTTSIEHLAQHFERLDARVRTLEAR